ncbi:MAG: hypothetical protein R6T92_00285, partial [Desulfosalsimonadaceae bacterium]
MKKWLIGGIILVAFAAFFPWSKEPPPSVVVETVFARITDVKDAVKKTKEEGSSKDAAKELAESRTSLQSAFLHPRKAKLIVFPLMMLDLEKVELVEERVDGKTAWVIIEYTVVGFGQKAAFDESVRKRDRMTFRLKKEKGRWLIADI